ncbi:YopX family protein [Bacillus amyloliquefaciens]|uniref:YopX family protein n=2 Tax=Bacillus amyloliquefaciens group TaxID=1938374 RepID=UPI00338D99DF
MNMAYRVWDGENMHYGDDVNMTLFIRGKGWTLYKDSAGLCPDIVASSLDRKSVLMWGTGLKDKSLYDGSIVKYGTFNYQIGVICYDTHQAMFKIVPVQFYLANSGNGGWTGNSISTTVSLKVIGNIYQNPELLEGAE